MDLQRLGLYLLILIFSFLIFRSFRKTTTFHFLPSLTWFSIMVLPYLLNILWVDQSYSDAQGVGISIIFGFMVLGDVLSERKRVEKLDFSPVGVLTNRLFGPLAFLIIAIPIIHFLYVGQIPILNMAWNVPASIQLAENREDFSKLANYPYAFKLLENYYFTLVAPIVLALAIKAKYIKFFSFLLIYSSFFAIASGAEFTVFMMIFFTILVTFFTLKPNFVTLLTFVLIGILTIILGFGILLESRLVNSSDNCGPRTLRYESTADKYRVCKESETVLVNPLVDKIGYRIFLTPIEVSSWWYTYYQNNSNRNLESLLDRDLKSQPSNIIGKIAYFERFPGQYLESVSAYSSVDADSFSFGWFYVWLTGFFLLLIRISSYIGLTSSQFASRAFGAILLGGLIVLPFTASIQAILLAQGMIVPLVSNLFLYLKLRKVNRNGIKK